MPTESRPVALITGASRGIGAATAIEFARRGYDLAITAPQSESLEYTAQEIRRAGGKSLSVPGDLLELSFAQSVIQETIAQFARIDVLVNNAAWRELITLREITTESWEKTLRVCLTAPVMLAKHAATYMEREKRGVILNVSSIMAIRATGLAPAYVAAKGALDALTYDLASLYGPAGIRVIGVSPGAIDSELSGDVEQSADDPLRAWTERTIPLRRWGSAQEVARVIAMLASEDASYITGTTVIVDGGWSHQLYPHSAKEDSTG